jgi:hypothetical protein
MMIDGASGRVVILAENHATCPEVPGYGLAQTFVPRLPGRGGNRPVPVVGIHLQSVEG